MGKKMKGLYLSTKIHIFVFCFSGRTDPRRLSPWELDGTSNDNHTSWQMDLELKATATGYLKFRNMLTKKRGGGKKSFFFFWFSIKSGPTCPKPQVWEGWWISWVSSWLALWFPKDHDDWWLRIHSTTQKVFFLFGTCLFLTVLHMPGHVYL